MDQLKPCPFCGKETIFIDGIYDRRSHPNHFLGNSMNLESWNSAYCWKQLDQHKETVRFLVEALKEAKIAFDWKQLDQHKETVRFLVEALKEAKIAFDWMLETEPRVAIPNDANETVDEALAKAGELEGK